MREVRCSSLTSPNLQAKAPNTQLGQPAMAGDEEIEVLLFDQPLQKGSFIESQPKPSVYGVALDWWPQSLFYFVRQD